MWVGYPGLPVPVLMESYAPQRHPELRVPLLQGSRQRSNILVPKSLCSCFRECPSVSSEGQCEFVVQGEVELSHSHLVTHLCNTLALDTVHHQQLRQGGSRVDSPSPHSLNTDGNLGQGHRYILY